MEQWFVYKKKANFNKIAKQFHIDPVVARLIRNRDIMGEENIQQYLHGNLGDISDPKLMYDAVKASKILREKIEQKVRIRIISDYDVDGVTSNYILYQAIKRLGGNVDFTIPNRITDGYGINEHLIERALREDIDTIITCDNGIAAKEAISFGKEHGMTMIVTDHHDVPFVKNEKGEKEEILPPADAIVNPKQEKCKYPYPLLCGAGVVFQLMQVLYEEMERNQKELEDLLAFLAIATVCDVVDLTGENRIFVKEGLKRLSYTNNAGLQALLKVHELENKEITSYDLGFVIGPCINASGRLDTAEKAAYLFLEKDAKKALDMAKELKELNVQRKQMTEDGVEDALTQGEKALKQGEKVLVVYLPDCHESIAGIIAGRVKDRLHHPTFMITKGEDGLKGSGRSIEAYSMFEEMSKVSDVFTKFGGHPMAAGLSLAEDRLEEFRQRINEVCTLTENDFISKIHIDIDMPVDYLSLDFVRELEVLQPFGKENKRPLFVHKNLKIDKVQVFGANKNVIRMMLTSNQEMKISGLLFEDEVSFFEKKGDNDYITCTYYPKINEYNGYENLQINIQNYFFTMGGKQ